jgi:hypothetical protein
MSMCICVDTIYVYMLINKQVIISGSHLTLSPPPKGVHKSTDGDNGHNNGQKSYNLSVEELIKRCLYIL